MPEFYPPQLKPTFVRLLQSVAPWYAHWYYQLDLEIRPACLEKLSALQEHRLLLLPNHPTFHDPIVIFLLSAQLRERFYYIAAHEAFQTWKGPFFQWLGVYSIRRGFADRLSIAQTLELLMQPSCRLVVFPEGGCSFQNDTVMPFRMGAVQFAFQAMNKLVKRDGQLSDLYGVPVSIKYRYTKDMNPVIHRTLHQLEKALKVSPASTSNFYERLRAVSEQVLVRCEQEYGLYTPEINQLSWNQRIVDLKRHVLLSCEQALGISAAPSEANRERVYRIQRMLQSQDDEPETDNHWNIESIRKAMMRLLNFDAIYDGYVAADPTPERFLDTLTRLEREVFSIDKPPPKAHRIAVIQIGEPVNLKEYFENYQQDRSGTINVVVQQIQQTVQQNLDLLNQDLL